VLTSEQLPPGAQAHEYARRCDVEAAACLTLAEEDTTCCCQHDSSGKRHLSAVSHFVWTARQALHAEREEEAVRLVSSSSSSSAGSKCSSCNPGAATKKSLTSSSASSSWALSAAERLLPDAAAQAAAAALAALHLRSLLQPKSGGVAAQVAAWTGAAALLVLGCTALLVFLAEYMLWGMVAVADLKLATGRMLGLHGGQAPPATAPLPPPPYGIVALLWVASLSATAQVLLLRHGSLGVVLLRLDRHALSLLALLAAISTMLASAILLATYLLSLADVFGAYLHHQQLSGLQQQGLGLADVAAAPVAALEAATIVP
jgi:hypothetical protein